MNNAEIGDHELVGLNQPELLYVAAHKRTALLRNKSAAAAAENVPKLDAIYASLKHRQQQIAQNNVDLLATRRAQDAATVTIFFNFAIFLAFNRYMGHLCDSLKILKIFFI